jgi:hypothetical protein
MNGPAERSAADDDGPSLSFLSSGQTCTVWRLDGAFEGCVARLPRPGAERPFGSTDPLARAIGRQYLHQRLADVPLDDETLSDACSEDATARAAALRTVGAAISAEWCARSIACRGCTATLDVDHTRMLLCSPRAGADAAPSPQMPFPPPVGSSEPCLCVEIKPKCGVLPAGVAATELLFGFCRFCVREKLKREPGGPRSGYCPLDLYSMDRPRVERALQSFLAAPRNNLRIFGRSGEQVFGAARGAAREALRRELRLEFGEGLGSGGTSPTAGCSSVGGQGEALETLLVQVVATILLQEPLLVRLKSVQAASTLSAEGALRAYDCACAAIGREEVDRRLRPRSDDAGGLSVRCPCAESAGLGLEHGRCEEADALPADLLDPVRAWLLALCASDISIMLCLRKLQADPATTHSAVQPDRSRAPGVVCLLGEGRGVFAYRVAVVDTMPKPPSKLAEHARRDREATSLPAPRAAPCCEKAAARRGVDGGGVPWQVEECKGVTA